MADRIENSDLRSMTHLTHFTIDRDAQVHDRVMAAIGEIPPAGRGLPGDASGKITAAPTGAAFPQQSRPQWPVTFWRGADVVDRLAAKSSVWINHVGSVCRVRAHGNSSAAAALKFGFWAEVGNGHVHRAPACWRWCFRASCWLAARRRPRRAARVGAAVQMARDAMARGDLLSSSRGASAEAVAPRIYLIAASPTSSPRGWDVWRRSCASAATMPRSTNTGPERHRAEIVNTRRLRAVVIARW